jgi:hypothetical protein
MDDTAGYGQRSQMQTKILDCVVAPDGPNGGLNHVELNISKDQIDVYATDAGTTGPLYHIAVITNTNLTLSRGLIWLEDVHYNAAKAQADENGPHRVHTFAWDNVGFDGPFTYHDLSYDALDAMTPAPNGAVSLGKSSTANAVTSWDVLGMPASPRSELVRVLFNFFDYTNPPELKVAVNGHAHTLAWPYPDSLTFTWRTIDMVVPITDLVAGTNKVEIGSNQGMVVSNVNIVLVNTDVTSPPTGTGTPAPTLTSTASPVATSTPQATPVATGTPVVVVPTETPTPSAVDCMVNVRIGGVERGWIPC